jgi:hypothetical protein
VVALRGDHVGSVGNHPAFARRAEWRVEPDLGFERATNLIAEWRASGTLPSEAHGLATALLDADQSSEAGIAAQREREPIKKTGWAAAMANPIAFIVVVVAGAIIIAGVVFAIVRSRSMTSNDSSKV